MSDEGTPKKAPRKESGGFFGAFSSKEEEKKPKTITVREEKKKLRRVVKAKPMSRKHMSEALEAHELTEKEIEITEQVMRTTVHEAPPEPREMQEAFKCIQCGAMVPVDSERCPKCKVLYVAGVHDEELMQLQLAEMEDVDDTMDLLDRSDSPVIHFDAELGIINYLEEDKNEADFVFECSHCGTLIQFDTDKCPICGTALELGDTGLVGLFANMDFDGDPLTEVDCPFCGEHVSLKAGKCPACGTAVEVVESKDAAKKVAPVVRSENVVFLHLDVETGELNYLQKLAHRLGLERVSVKLDGIGKGGFEESWGSLSRV